MYAFLSFELSEAFLVAISLQLGHPPRLTSASLSNRWTYQPSFTHNPLVTEGEERIKGSTSCPFQGTPVNNFSFQL
jgi:hypothetical protein